MLFLGLGESLWNSEGRSSLFVGARQIDLQAGSVLEMERHQRQRLINSQRLMKNVEHGVLVARGWVIRGRKQSLRSRARFIPNAM